MGSTKKRMLLTEEIGIGKSIEQISGIRTIQNGGVELIEYLSYIYHPKMDSENEQSYHQV